MSEADKIVDPWLKNMDFPGAILSLRILQCSDWQKDKVRATIGLLKEHKIPVCFAKYIALSGYDAFVRMMQILMGDKKG